MAPTDRVWTGDTEIVYETARGYEWFVAELVVRHDDETHHCWLQRHNDFLDPHLLDVFNAVIGGTRRFVWNHTGGGVEVRLVGTEP